MSFLGTLPSVATEATTPPLRTRAASSPQACGAVPRIKLAQNFGQARTASRVHPLLLPFPEVLVKMFTEDEDIYTGTSSTQSDSIRPSLNDLRNAANYDADTLQWPSSAKVSKGVAPPTIASRQSAAATSSTKSKGKKVRIAPPTEDDVRYYQPQPRAREDVPQPWSSGQHEQRPVTEGSEFDNMTPGRFVLPLEGENGESSSSAGASPIPAIPSLPMVGGIQERKPARSSQSRDSASSKSSLPPASSRFKAMKQAERQRGEQDHNADSLAASKSHRAPPVVKSRVPPISHRVAPSHASQYLNDDDVPRAQRDATAIASSGSIEEEWLDENGNVMSAFRKARLQKQGADPPGGKRRLASFDRFNSDHTIQIDTPLSQNGSSSGHDDGPALSRSISRENEDQIESMSPADVQSNVAELQSVISPDLLEQLKNRKHAAENAPQPGPSSGPPEAGVDSLLNEISLENERKLKAMKAEDVEADLHDLQMMFGRDVLDGLRERKTGGKGKARVIGESSKFPVPVPPQTASPASPVPPESALRPPKSPVSNLGSIRFDAMGKLLPVSCTENGEAQNHEHEGHTHPHTNSDGYNIESLLLLCRSTVAGQRIMALNMISRVCSLYSPGLAFGDRVSPDTLNLEPGSTPSVPVVATLLRKADTHLNTALVAVMLLNDRQRSVRHAALSALRTAMLFGNVDTWVEPTKTASNGEDHGSRRPSAIHRILDAGLFGGLLNVLEDEDEVIVSRELVVQILLQLIRADHTTAGALLHFNSGKLVFSLLQHCLKTHWPPARNSMSTPLRYPSPACVTLLHEVVRSSRKNAETLIKKDTLDILLRFVAVGPWLIDGTGLDAKKEQIIGYELLFGSLSVYRSLARYGLQASLVSRAWGLLEPVQQWVHQYPTTSQDDKHSRHLQHLQSLTASQFYHLVSIWTTCALDPHQTTPEHEVTWSQVEEWIEPSLDLTQDFLKAGIAGIHAKVFAALCEHVIAWLECAAKNGPQRREKAVGRLCGLLDTHRTSLLEQLRTIASPAHQSPVQESDDDATSDNDGAEEQVGFQHERLADSCDVFLQLLTLARAIGNESLATDISSLAILEQSDGTSLLTKGLEALSHLEHESHRLVISYFLVSIHANLPSATASLLELLSKLKSGEETIALQAMDLLLAQATTDQEDAQAANTSQARPSHLTSTLRPFFLECLGMRPNPASEVKRPLKYAPAKTTSSDLKRTQSLLWPTRVEIAKSLDSEQDEVDSDNKDPVTGSVLWKSPASCGLPLRPDWPLLPLDDLLRSAESAVFNRADNLPADWDPTERQVVQASLHLMNWCCAGNNNNNADVGSTMPGLTSTHLYLGAQKVFMLESGIQGDPRKWTGAVTGKDLFRDATIAPLLRTLMTVHADSMARQEFTQPQGRDFNHQPATLDQLAPRHFGEETSYYSFYTDLIGLYDSISYGDELFALSLLPPLATRLHQDSATPAASSSGYPVDYRRLFWKDYAHLLPTIRTSIQSAPGGSERYLPRLGSISSASSSSYAEETEMLQAYTTAVLDGHIGPDQQGLLWSIATHHIAVAIWPEEGNKPEDPRAKSLAGAVFSEGSEVLQGAVLSSVVNDANGHASEEQIVDRVEWLKTSCGIASVKVV